MPTAAPRKRTTARRTAPKAIKAPASRGATFSAFRDEMYTEGLNSEVNYERLLRQYGRSTTWTYVAVNRIASAASQIPMQVVSIRNTRAPEIVPADADRGLSALLNTPNEFQSYTDFVDLLFSHLELTGNAYIFKHRMIAGRPRELWLMNPGEMVVVPDRKNFVRGYKWRRGAASLDLDREQIIHVKYTNPSNAYYGMGSLEAARLAAETDTGALQWNRRFMQKGGWPSGALQTEHELKPDAERRLKRNIREMLQQGKDQAGLILLLTGGLEYKAIAINPKDADWLNSRRFSRDEILAIFNVPFAVAGIFATEQTSARSAGVLQQVRNFYVFNVLPKMRRFKAALERELVPAFNSRFRLEPDLRAVPALADDLQRELLRANVFRLLTRNGWSINDALEELYPHRKPVPWGDVFWAQQATVPLKDNTNPFVALAPDPNEEPEGEDAEEETPEGRALGARLAHVLQLEGPTARAVEDLCAQLDPQDIATLLAAEVDDA